MQRLCSSAGRCGRLPSLHPPYGGTVDSTLYLDSLRLEASKYIHVPMLRFLSRCPVWPVVIFLIPCCVQYWLGSIGRRQRVAGKADNEAYREHTGRRFFSSGVLCPSIDH